MTSDNHETDGHNSQVLHISNRRAKKVVSVVKYCPITKWAHGMELKLKLKLLCFATHLNRPNNLSKKFSKIINLLWIRNDWLTGNGMLIMNAHNLLLLCWTSDEEEEEETEVLSVDHGSSSSARPRGTTAGRLVVVCTLSRSYRSLPLPPSSGSGHKQRHHNRALSHTYKAPDDHGPQFFFFRSKRPWPATLSPVRPGNDAATNKQAFLLLHQIRRRRDRPWCRLIYLFMRSRWSTGQS